MNLLQDLRRRRIFRMIGLYIVGAWLTIQVGATFFPAWGVPDTALRYLIVAAGLGFPVALVFSWFFDITSDGIVRTAKAKDSDTVDLKLRRPDYVILCALAVVAIAILFGSFEKVRQATDDQSANVDQSERPPNSIAVLPFVNMDDDVDTEYFSDGVTEEVLHRLSSVQTLAVIGRTSSFAFKNSDIEVPRLCEILNVKYLLQGSVRRDGNEVRVIARLVDDSGAQVWSETFDRRLERIFAIQSEIANEVAGQLAQQIAPPPELSGRATANMDAYQEYLVGRSYFNRRPPNWIPNAIAAYQRSIDLDSRFALPYAGLAFATGLSGDFSSVAERLEKSQAYVDSALQIQPDLAEAHAVQGLLLIIGKNPAAAEIALRRALELNPSHVIAYGLLATAVGAQGRHRESVAIREQAQVIDPLNPVIITNIAARYGTGGDFRRAETLLLRLMDLPETPSMVYRALYRLNDDYGKLDKAIEWVKRLIPAVAAETSTSHYRELAIFYEKLGMSGESDYWHSKSASVNPGGLNPIFQRVYLLRLRGMKDQTGQMITAITQRPGFDYRNLVPFQAKVFAAMQIEVGNYDLGIEILESEIDVDAPISVTTNAGSMEIDWLQTLAFAYAQSGDIESANTILEKNQSTMALWNDEGFALGPQDLERTALNQAMLGSSSQALESLEAAASMGWRNYFYVLNDLRWQDTLQNPEFKSLMSWVKADIDRQRERVEAINRREDFRALVEQMESASRR